METGDELSERKKHLLKAIIEVHIRRGEPVGSKFLIQDKQIRLSSATIRNEMAELESLGYLEQPHTSAGRVPSKLGYRFYVDTLMNRYAVTTEELEQLDRLHAAKQEERDRILADAARLASHMTNYPSFSVRARPENLCVRRFDTVLTDVYHFLLVMTTSTGEVKTRNIRLTFPVDAHVLRRLTVLLNECVAGRQMRQISMPEIMRMEKEMGIYNVLISPILKSVYGALREMGSGDIRFEGVNRFLQYPEFADMERVRELFDMMDSREELLDMVEEADPARVNVVIGSNTGVDTIDNSAVVFRPLTEHDRTVGAVGVIGPCRMDYERVVSLVDRLTKTVSDMLADSGGRPGLPEMGGE